MRPVEWTILLSAVVLLGACTQALRLGRCNSTNDCAGASANAEVCNLDPTPQGNGRCVPSCKNTGDCEGGKTCDFDLQGEGRCLLVGAVDGGDADGGIDGADGAGDDGRGEAPQCPVCAGTAPVCVGVTCVECASSADCASDSTKPICDTNAHSCVPCSSDDQCVAKLGADPGVCMAHQDGHCAIDAETIYVEPKTGSDCRNVLQSDADGTAAVPLCTLELARRVLASDSAQAQPRTLVRVRGTLNAAVGPFTRTAGRPEASIVGQQGAVVVGAAQPGIDLQSGLFYVRGLKVSPAASVGIRAVPGPTDSLTLRLDGVTVDSCQQGGILLGGAAFDLRNTVVTNNGPGQQGAIIWGGILVNALPATGPAQIELVTISNNKGPGLTCSGSITGWGVFASGNSTAGIASACGFSACQTPSPTCGAPP